MECPYCWDDKHVRLKGTEPDEDMHELWEIYVCDKCNRKFYLVYSTETCDENGNEMEE